MNVKSPWRALSLACLIATGCGGQGGNRVETASETSTTAAPVTTMETSTSTTVAASTTTSTRARATTTTTAETSVLRRRDSRPGDVKELADYYLGGPPPRGFACAFDRNPAPNSPTVLVDPKLFLGEATTICAYNFTGTAKITLQVSRGSTNVWSASVSPKSAQDDSDPSATFATMPGDPTGTYTVTATQGSLRATTTFTVEHAVNQHILVVAESPGRGVQSVRRGTTVHIGLAGWTPGQTVPLSIHYSPSTTPGGDAKFITLLSVTVDSRGQRLYELATKADDARGCYVVNTRPAEEPKGALGRLGPSIVTFCLT